MKKFLLVLAILFIAHLGCKKIDKEDRLCACSPISQPMFTLVIKKSGVDLLNSTINGSFAKNQIQLYTIDESGKSKAIVFMIRSPFVVDTEKLDYYQLVSYELLTLAISDTKSFYLKLGDEAPVELNFVQNTTTRRLKLLIDKKEAVRESREIVNSVGGNVFYYDK
jgi:hypothetical protein